MKDKINTYFATLIVTVFGAGAALLIVHIAYTDTTVTVLGNEAVIYTYLQ